MFDKIKNTTRDVAFGIRLTLSGAPIHSLFVTILFIIRRLLPLFEAYTLKELINGALLMDFAHIYWAGACFIISIVLSGLIESISDLSYEVFEKKMAHYIDNILIDKIVTSDYSFFDNANQQDVLHLVQKNQRVIQSVTWQSLYMISSLIALCSTLTLLTVLSPILTLLILITAIPTVLVNKRFQNFLWNYDYLHSTIHRKAEYLYSVLASHAAVEELRINDAEQYFESQYKLSWKLWYDEKLRSSVRHNFHLFAANLLQILSIGLVFIYAIIRFIDKMISLGDIQFYVNISEQIKSNVIALFDTSADMQLNSDKISMFRNFIHWTPTTLRSGELAPNHLSEIEFSHVGFKYPGTDEWVLRDCSFVISPGKHVALVGRNGAGKSTIVKLLCRFYDVSEGAILIDGKNIKEYDTKKYRRNFTALFQEINTYSMTLLENITISDIEKFDENRLNYAIDFAGISNLLKEYTLHSPVTKVFSDYGMELSGGQRQKLALARAIYRNSAFVILDEPSSALDPEAEYSMMKKFIEMYNDKSALLISHRLANAALCDEIVVIDDRHICERGTHTHLMQLDGVYARLFRLQAERYLNDSLRPPQALIMNQNIKS